MEGVSKLSGRPCIVQLTKAPVFKGAGSDNVLCKECGHTLVSAVDMRSLIAIDIECHICKAVTCTPSWPEGESLPQQLISLGSTGKYGISQVQIGRDVAFSCDAEIERIRSSTRAKPLLSRGSVPLTNQLPSAWEAELNILTENEFSKQIAAARRAHASGNRRFVKCPPAWAIVHLQSQLSVEKIGTSEEDAIAMGYMAQVRDLIDRWNHHHHFPLIVNALCSEFNHTAAMLATAAYLGEKGNDVGITDTASASGQSPDLYINTGPQSRLSIEVKAPTLLFWPSPVPSLGDMEKHIHRSLRAAKGQLSGESGGVVFVAASHPDPGAKAIFETAVANVIRSGKVSSRIAALGAVFHSFGQRVSDGRVNWQAMAHIWAEQNPRFAGENPVSVR